MNLEQYKSAKDIFAKIGCVLIGVEVEIQVYRGNKSKDYPLYTESSRTNNKGIKCLYMKRDIRPYLVIEPIDKSIQGSIKISYNVLWQFTTALQTIMSLIPTDAFIEEDGVVKANKKIRQTMITSFGSVLTIEPYFDSTQCDISEQRRIKIQNQSGFGFTLSINDYFGFTSIIMQLNIVEIAQNIVNFLPEPEFGKRIFDMDIGEEREMDDTFFLMKKKGFFDKD